MATIIGTNSNNILNGTASADTIIGRAGNDTLNGSGGNDRLNGGVGTDRLNGGTGIDTADYSNVTIGGTTYIGATAGVTVNLNLTAAQNTGGAGIDTLTSIENLTGTNFNDSLTGNGANNVLSGLAGNDTLVGGGGNDHLTGGRGNNWLDGGTGIDTASYSTASAGVDIDLKSSNPYLNGSGGLDTLVNIENLIGTNSNDRLYGNAGNNMLSGLAGNDVLRAWSDGENVLDGGAGDDQLSGAKGNDVLRGGAGADVMGGGNGHDQLDGGAGTDVMDGGAGHDRLTGGDGTDHLNGNEGNDVLLGGLGADILNGGLGNDTFDYNAVSESPAGTTGRDIIELFRGNFYAEGDRIDLRDIDANSVQSGNQAFSYIGFDSFTAPGQLRYSSLTGILQGNTDADTAPEFEIQLVGGPVLTINSVVSDILL